jgi:hypothetical protein
VRVEERHVEAYRSLLGLPASGATIEDVRRCHRREMLRWHPDRGGDGERARLLNEARDYLVRHPDRITPSESEQGFECGRDDLPMHVDVGCSSEAASVPESRDGRASDAMVTMVKMAVIGYFILLGIAVLGWLLTTILPML